MRRHDFQRFALALALLSPAAVSQERRPEEPHGRAAPLARLGLDTLVERGFRTIDGWGNNEGNPDWGSAHVDLTRWLPSDYADGFGAPSGAQRASAREISNIVAAQDRSRPNRAGLSDFVWMWGQFVDHDIDLTPVLDPPEPFDIPVPAGDPYFDPTGSGTVTIPLDRSFYVETDRARQQVNAITAFIDASNVYGSDEERMLALRTLDGTGRLKTSAGDLLPYNTAGLPNAPAPVASFFLAGDERANEQAALIAMHTLFVREHNYWADRIRSEGTRDEADDRGESDRGGGRERSGRSGGPERRALDRGEHAGAQGRTLTGEEIYQLARCIVAAEMQAITYREFLPALLGPRALAPYRGYRSGTNPSVANAFATAAYRLGHSLLSPTLLRLDATGAPIEAGHLSLASAFFAPQEIEAHGIASLLRGLAAQEAQELDPYLIDDVRNFLFGPPGSGGFDLAALNIQRGRDHGLPDYNDAREALGLPRARGFAEVSSDPRILGRLRAAYVNVNDVDLWVGGLAEDHVGAGSVGGTFRTILSRQFEAIRDGDRYWYQRYLPHRLVRMVEDQTLARIIRRNTEIEDELPDDVFHVSQ